MPQENVRPAYRFFYYWIVLYTLYFPLVVLVSNFYAYPRIPDILDAYLFEEFFILWGVNLLSMLPAMILPVLTVPSMLLMYVVLILPTLVYAGCYVVFGRPLDYELSQYIWNSNWNQAYEFLRAMISPSVLIVAVILTSIPIVIMFCTLRVVKPRSSWKRVLCLTPLLAVALFYKGYLMRLDLQHHTRWWYETHVRVHLFKTYAREFYKFHSMYGWEKTTLEIFVKAPKENFPLENLKFTKEKMPITGIVLVGESASKLHHGIYGYFRNTTPRLEAMRDDLFIFDNVEIASSSSMRSLLGAFSFVDREHGSYYDYKCSIFDITNEAGYETWWFTNSIIENIIAFSKGDSFIRLLNTNVKHYRDVQITTEEGKRLDIALIPFMGEAMDTSFDHKSIFARFNGSHLEYSNRYPSDFPQFKDYPLDDPKRPWLTRLKTKVIDEYDTTIRYTDYVISEIIEEAKKRGGNSFVLYFSDHGEEVFTTADFIGRVDKEPVMTPAIMKIPLVLWLSEDYKRNFPEITAAAQKNLHKGFVLDDLIWTMTELYGLTFNEFEPEKSLVNINYIPVSVDLLPSLLEEIQPVN